MVPNPLADAAPQALQSIWSERHKIKLERHLWIAVMRTQQDLGLPFPAGAIEAYERAAPHIYESNIHKRELRTRHDVKARLEEFNNLAGFECAHRGMTSADCVDNVEQWRIRQSLRWLIGCWPDQLESLICWVDRYPLRGIKGPVGTQQDQIDLLGLEGARELDRRVAQSLGFNEVLGSVPQTYHRSLDLEMASRLMSATAGLGSNRWPARALGAISAGFVSMLAGISGDCWNEGDVSSSVVRRVALPGTIFTASIALSEGLPFEGLDT